MVVYGKQIFHYLLEHHSELIQEIYLTKRVDRRVFADIGKLGVSVERIDNRRAQALARGGNHQGFIVRIKDFVFSTLNELKLSDFLVLLHGITDVGNIGSIVRSAYALGADGVVVSGIGSLKMEGVIRASSGAALDLPIALEPNGSDLIKELQDVGFKIYAADMEGEDIRKVSIPPKRAILLGSEGDGLPKKLIQRCDKIVKIVMKRDFDSLNVSAAAAIFIDRMRDE